MTSEHGEEVVPAAFVEMELDTAEELLAQLLPHQDGLLWRNRDSQSWLFRGQMDANWKLTPSAMRDGTIWAYTPGQAKYPKRGSSSPEENARREADLVLDFVAQADLHGIHLPHDSPELRNDDWFTGPARFPDNRFEASFALAQHYGVPTRLLDWSRKSIVGAYFACHQIAEYTVLGYEDHNPRYGLPATPPTRFAVWALNQSVQRGGDRDFEDGYRVVTAPGANNANLHAQAGCFTVVEVQTIVSYKRDPPSIDDFIRNLSFSQDELRLLGPALVKFTIPTPQSGRLLRLLSQMDVTAASVFPGLGGIERQLFERKLHRW